MHGGLSNLLLSAPLFHSIITLRCCWDFWDKKPLEQLFDGAHLLAHHPYSFFKLYLAGVHLYRIYPSMLRRLIFPRPFRSHWA